MAHKVETMAYAGEVPWHGLGESVSHDLTPEEMLKAAKLDWTVSKQPLYIKPNGDASLAEVPRGYAITRDSDHKVLSIVGETYKPVQNAEALDFFKKFTEAGHMKMETAGSLSGGRYIWALARVGEDFKLGKSDEVRSFLLLMSPHTFGKSLIIQFTPIRVVCWNTLSLALGSSLKGTGTSFRMPHTQVFDARTAASAEMALGIAKSDVEQFREASILLSKKKAKPEQVEEFFCRVLQFNPKETKDGKKPREPLALPKLRQALTHAPGQQLNTAAGTWWGALHSVTYVFDHETGTNRDTALTNAWIGHKATLKRKALEFALEYAK